MKQNTKTKRIGIRLTETEREMFDRVSAYYQRPITDILVDLVSEEDKSIAYKAQFCTNKKS